MHSTMLDATGYTLLLSSFVALAFLSWKGCKRKKKSPFYILSTSDVFSAALTAIMLLMNHIETGMKLSYDWQNNTSRDVPNRAWTIEDKYRFPFIQVHDLRDAVNEIDHNATLTCGMKDVLMQYGTLLAALTNAFISLLTFTTQCSFNIACIRKRCANMESLRNVDSKLESKDAEIKRRESEEEPISLQRENINVKSRSNIIQRFMEISKFRALKDDRKPTSFLVTTHWLIPFLVVGILYFAEYSDMNNVKYTEDVECEFENNFPMYDFDIFSDTDDNLNIIDSVLHTTLPEYDHLLNEKISNRSEPSSVEIDEVVSKVRNIIGTALNNRHNSTKDIGTTHSLNTPDPQNLTDYILAINTMRYIKNITNVNNVIRGLNDTPIEWNINVHNSSTNNVYLNQDSELDATTPGNLSSASRMSVENENDGYHEDAQIHFANTESTTQMITNTTSMQNATFVSNNQIYGEIMKRIQAASAHSAAKNYFNRSVSRPRDREQLSNLKNIAKRKSNSIKDLFFSKNDNRYTDVETKQSSSVHMINECLISTKFLKLQLFVLSFMIYFLPILLSCILQMRGKHMCKNTLAMLRAKTHFSTASSKKIHQQDSVGESSTSQGLRNDHSGIDTMKKDHESCRENESVILEIDCMVRILNTIKLSLILCVVLWTPVFLGTLLKVYSCTHAPQWLTDTTLLSAFSFGIVRNVLNINIIRIQETCSDASTKENRIHPVE